MTEIIDPQTEHATPEDASAATLMHVDPHALTLETNVRDDAALDKQFVASIQEHGVLIPITAVHGRDGKLWVRAGQRRTLAAREAGLATVPVYVRAAGVGDDKALLVERVAEQIVENDQRRQLTDAQRARGIQQMIDAGASITKVSKKLSLGKDTVKAAAAVGNSDTAMRCLADGQLSLEEAAALTEFEDTPGALSRLMQAAGSRRFEHLVSQLRQEKITAEAEAKAAQSYIDQGFAVLDEQPSFDPDCVPLYRLRTAEDSEADESAVTHPSLWAVMLFESEGLADVETGAVVDEDEVDWDTQDDPEATPAAGLRHAATVTETIVFTPQYFCLNYRAAGLTLDAWFARQAGLVESDSAAGSTVDLDDEAREVERQRIAAERAEAETRERRKVLALNKLGAAAQTVRREFVKKLLARKTAPKGAAIFVADCLARDSYLLTNHNAAEMTAELLGLDNAHSVSKVASTLSATADARAQVITLGLVLAALEARTLKDSWRNPATTNNWSHHVTCGDYLKWLAANGYTLAPVEEVIAGDKTADEVYDLHLAEVAQN